MKVGTWISERATRTPGPRADTSPLLLETRLFVLDADVTGTHFRRDRALGIATLPVEAGEFRLGDLAYCPIDPPGDAEQETNWRERYRTLVDAMADTPILTYNVRFVKHMIKRAALAHDLPLPFGLWIDIAAAVYGIVGNATNEIESMAYWQERMKIRTIGQHSAIADVFAMAQSLQSLLAYCEDMGVHTLDDLRKAQNARVWLRG